MRTRTILYTGKGGVGKTSVAACTGRACATSGLRTLVISTDPAHSLSESLCEEVGGIPTRVSPRLWGQEVDAQAELERHWSGVQQWLGELFIERGVDRISAEELTVPPGMDELFSLLRLQAQHQSGEWEAIVADCAVAARHPAPEPGCLRRHPAPVGEPDRDERDPPRPSPLHGSPGHEPRQ